MGLIYYYLIIYRYYLIALGSNVLCFAWLIDMRNISYVEALMWCVGFMLVESLWIYKFKKTR